MYACIFSMNPSPEGTSPTLVCKILALFSVLLRGTADSSPKTSYFFPFNFTLGFFSTDLIPQAAESRNSGGCGGRIDVSITAPSIHIYFEWVEHNWYSCLGGVEGGRRVTDGKEWE